MGFRRENVAMPSPRVLLGRSRINPAKLIHHVVVRESYNDFGIVHQNRDWLREERWLPFVVIVQNRDIFTDTKFGRFGCGWVPHLALFHFYGKRRVGRRTVWLFRD